MWRRERGWTPAEIREFYGHAARARPRRQWARVAGLMVGLAGGGALVLWGKELAAMVCVAAAVGVPALWSGRCVEVLRTGGLRWTHRERGLIEIELLGGGRSWRRDLREVASASLGLDDGEWRSLRVTMVTAVFPVRWLRNWGFEVRACGWGTRGAYRLGYLAQWLVWRMGAVIGEEDRPRYRRRGCVRATHRMGAWMEVVWALPAGLRR